MQTLRFDKQYLRDDTVHVKIDGKIDPATTVQFSWILWGMFAQGCHRILLDLSKVSSIDSTGVGVLINATETAREHDGLIVLINPSEKVQWAMKTLNLATLFTFADSREAAEGMLAE